MNLTILTFLPLLGALATLLVPGERKEVVRLVAFATTAFTAGLGLLLWFGFDAAAGASAQHVVDRAWFELPGADGATPVHYKLGVDGLSILLVVLTTSLMPIVVLSSWGHVSERVKEFMVWLLVMETGMLGVFLALDLVLFYFFWEISLIPLYFLIGIWGGERRLYATVKFFLFTLAGSLVMMIGVIALIWRLGTSDVEALTRLAGDLPHATQAWLFGAFALAFAIKVPVVPFHTWLADAHTEAPTSGSVLLAGVLLKMGTYGLIRFGIAMFPAGAVQFAPLFMALGAIGIVYGAFLAMAQSDLKRLVACSSVSHLGFCVLGMFALTHAGLSGSVLQMVNHGLSTGLLFLLVGMIYERRHTRELDQFGGLAVSMPLFAVFFVVTVLSSVGLPGLNGFVGEYLILLGAFQASPFWGIVSVTGVIFGAVYLLMATRRMLWGPLVREENKGLADLDGREIGMMLPMVAMTIVIGVAPSRFLSRVDPARRGGAGARRRRPLRAAGEGGRQDGRTGGRRMSALDSFVSFDAAALYAISPLLALSAGVLALLLVGVLPAPRWAPAAVVALSLGLALGLQLGLLGADEQPGLVLGGTLVASEVTAVWGLIFIAGAGLTWLFSRDYYVQDRPFVNEHDALVLTTPVGMMLMAGAQDLIVFFIGLELLSIPLYALAAFRRSRARSVEAGLKYFLLGAFAAAFFLYGSALIYAGTGTVSLVELRQTGIETPLAMAGVALVAAGLFFKISVFPFHLWVPDVYQGSPTPIAGLMATGTKAAALAFLLNATFLLPDEAATLVGAIALVTMAAGNLGALVQDDVKRMLAYSGIAHAGTVLLVVAGAQAGDPEPGAAVQAALFYMAAYLFTAAGAFGLLALLERGGERFTTLVSLQGLARTRPFVAAGLTLFLLSLGGIPATGGFLGKYLVFSVAVRADLIAIAVLGILLSVIALGYYLRVIVAMYMQPPSEGLEPAYPEPPFSAIPATCAAGLCAAFVLLMGVLPGWFLERM